MFSIPNSADAYNTRQAQPDSVDFGVLAQQHQAQGVRSGLAVTQKGAGADMSVDVAGGMMVWNGLTVSIATSTTNKAVSAADATNPRFDIVSAKNDGTLTVTAGTPDANPVFPAVPASSVALAAIYVPANETTITTAHVIDKRAFVVPIEARVSPPPVTANAMDDEFDDSSGMSGPINGLDARWTWQNQSTTTITYPTPGWATISPPARAGDSVRQIWQAAPAGNWTVEAKVSLGAPSANVFIAGIYARDGTNGDFYFLDCIIGTGSVGVEVTRFTNDTTWDSTPKTASTYGSNSIYLRIQYTATGTRIAFWVSADGIGWERIYEAADAVGVTQFGIAFNETANTGLSKLHVDYFRKVA